MYEIVTDNREHELVSWYDLTEDKQAGSDYLYEPESKGELRFFERDGDIYDIGDYTAIYKLSDIRPEFKDWDGIAHDTYFCGTLIKFVDNNYDSIVFGRYMVNN